VRLELVAGKATMTITRAILAVAFLTIPAIASLGCGAAEGSGEANGLDSGPGVPSGITLSSSNGQVLVDWSPVAGALGYAVHWELGAEVDAESPIKTVSTPPCLFENLPGGQALQVVVASVGPGGEGEPSGTKMMAVAPGGAEKFFPPWADAVPSQVLEHDYNPSLSSAQNGANLKGLLQGLTAGEELQIGSGTWTIDSLFDLSLQGTAEAPIWITAQAGAKPVITRSDANQNAINIGQNNGARYLALRGLEVRGGDIAVRIREASHIWIDQCELHACANNAVAANSDPVDHLYITRNEIHDTAGFGEGLYIGGNFATAVAHDCVIAQNHVYDTGGTQGDGIELKQGSWGNLIAENFVHDTNYPCILVYGTAGLPVNVVERNLCIGSGDAVLQVQGEAIVRNNVLANGATGFLSTDHQGETRDLTFVHNTIVNAGTAAQLTSWNGRPGMTFANNAAYSQGGNAIQFTGGSTGVLVTGNVAFGAVTGVLGGYALGSGLGDFAAATWDGALLDVTPKATGALAGAGAAAQMVVLDLSGSMRLPKLEAGAVDAP
jgi:hypothetical protein